MRWHQRGFTLIELVAIIVIIGVIAAISTPRYNSAAASTLAGRDDFVAALFYAQQIAMARASATNAVSLQVNGAGTQVSVTQTLAPTNLRTVNMPAGVTISAAPVTLTYSKLGTTTATTFTVTGADGNATVSVASSGYAR